MTHQELLGVVSQLGCHYEDVGDNRRRSPTVSDWLGGTGEECLVGEYSVAGVVW